MQTGNKVNPNEGYTFDLLRLNGGLDLVSNKVDAPRGSLLDCLNREVVDKIGYKRIDGYEPYNANGDAFNEDYYYIQTTSFTPPLNASFSEGSPLVVDGSDTVFGIAVELETIAGSPDTYRIYFSMINESATPQSGDTVITYGSSSDFVSGEVFSVAENIDESASEMVSRFNGYSDTLRFLTQTYPGNAGSDTPPAGLHWFRDRLYAVANDGWFYFDSGGTTEPLANQFLGTTTDRSRIISVQLDSGTWAGGDAKGIIQLDTEVPLAWVNNTNLNTYTASTGGSVITSNILTVAAAGDFTTLPVPQYASLWQSRNLQQSIDENGDLALVGWERIDHGWQADYDTGFSSYGGFTIVERGSENNFTFESDDIDTFPYTIFNGTNLVGSAFAPKTSSVGAGNRVVNGYPGWKTNASATVFASPDALVTATEAADANYAYANIWYYGDGDPTGLGAIPGALTGFDQFVIGPVDTYNGRSSPTVTGATFDSDFFTTQARAPLILNDFTEAASLIPDGAIVQGVEVTVSYGAQHYAEGQFAADRNGTNGADITANTIIWVEDSVALAAQFCQSSTTTEATPLGLLSTTPVLIDTTAGNYNEDITSTADTDTFKIEALVTGLTSTIGSSTDTLGVDNLTKQTLLDPSYGIALFGQITGAPLYPLSPAMQAVTPSGYEFLLGVIRLKITRVVVTFHYTVPSARYFVGDGTADVCTVDLIYYVREDGSFSSGTAEGTLQFTNLIADVAGTKRTVEIGDKFYATETDATGDLNPILSITSNIDYNGLPSLERILANNSRYQMRTANFFGREDWDGFYGVSGAGKAFSFATYNADSSPDGSLEDYIVNITTNTEDMEGDIPRHVAYHHNSLALGYKSGIVRFSVPGEPENFDGALGAAEIGIGDEVTGLISMRGTTLGVYCENSIWGISGTDADNFQTEVLSPTTGALEYTVVDMGLPIHCDTRGISTLEQSEKYGNFLGQRLSQVVTPFLTGRMLQNTAQFSGKGVVCAIPVRGKNQYRVFFKDGMVLVMTINPDQPPSFTKSEYIIDNVDQAKFIPIAWSSEVDDTGVERLHFSHYSRNVSTPYVYEFDRGWGFAGNFIQANYITNWYYSDPFKSTTIKKLRMDGLTQGISSCNVLTAKDYLLDFGTSPVDISLPRASDTSSYTVDAQPQTNMANIAERGRAIAIKVQDVELDIGPTPPDIHQIMLVQFDPGGKTDA